MRPSSLRTCGRARAGRARPDEVGSQTAKGGARARLLTGRRGRNVAGLGRGAERQAGGVEALGQGGGVGRDQRAGLRGEMAKRAMVVAVAAPARAGAPFPSVSTQSAAASPKVACSSAATPATSTAAGAAIGADERLMIGRRPQAGRAARARRRGRSAANGTPRRRASPAASGALPCRRSSPPNGPSVPEIRKPSRLVA